MQCVKWDPYGSYAVPPEPVVASHRSYTVHQSRGGQFTVYDSKRGLSQQFVDHAFIAFASDEVYILQNATMCPLVDSIDIDWTNTQIRTYMAVSARMSRWKLGQNTIGCEWAADAVARRSIVAWMFTGTPASVVVNFTGHIPTRMRGHQHRRIITGGHAQVCLTSILIVDTRRQRCIQHTQGHTRIWRGVGVIRLYGTDAIRIDNVAVFGRFIGSANDISGTARILATAYGPSRTKKRRTYITNPP